MKLLSLIILLFSFTFLQAQTLEDSNEESLVTFTSSLIDYEILNDKVVALTRKNQEYFIYFTDTKGAKLFESFDIFFATDLEIDCMGNLFVVGLDSAIQIEVSDYVTRIQSLDKATYKANIQTCKALFEESLVRTFLNNSLIYEPLDDSVYATNPILFTIQIWSNNGVKFFKNPSNSNRASNLDATLKDDPGLNLSNDILNPTSSRRNNTRVYPTNTSYGVANELTAFQVGDSLWAIDERNELLFIYDEYGRSDGVKNIDQSGPDFKLCQDRQTQDIYFLSPDASRRLIQKLDQNGDLGQGASFYKGFSRSSLKISNGYLYFRDSKGSGESIKRVLLN